MLTIIEVPQWQGSTSPTAPQLVEGAATRNCSRSWSPRSSGPARTS